MQGFHNSNCSNTFNTNTQYHNITVAVTDGGCSNVTTVHQIQPVECGFQLKYTQINNYFLVFSRFFMHVLL